MSRLHIVCVCTHTHTHTISHPHATLKSICMRHSHARMLQYSATNRVPMMHGSAPCHTGAMVPTYRRVVSGSLARVAAVEKIFCATFQKGWRLPAVVRNHVTHCTLSGFLMWLSCLFPLSSSMQKGCAGCPRQTSLHERGGDKPAKASAMVICPS